MYAIHLVKRSNGLRHIHRPGRRRPLGPPAAHVADVDLLQAGGLDLQGLDAGQAAGPRRPSGRRRGPATAPVAGRRRRRSAPGRGPSGGASGWSRLAKSTETRNVCAFSSSSGSARISFPLCKSATWLATRSTSPIWWLERSTVRPAPARSTMLSRNSRRTSTSSPEVGSSRINSGGSEASASDSETLARIPLESALIFRFGGSSKPRPARRTAPGSRRSSPRRRGGTRRRTSRSRATVIQS